jgi:hypothetical protein
MPDYFEEMAYPLKAWLTHAEGAVVILLKLDDDGRVLTSTALSGARALVPDCISNSKRWRFPPGSRRSAILIYLFRIEGVCHLPCRSQFLFRPPNLATITIGEPTIESQRQKFAAAVPVVVSEGEAIQLATLARRSIARFDLPGLTASSVPCTPAANVGYYCVEVAWNNPGPVGDFRVFDVDSRTGDIRDAVICREYTSSAIRDLQKRIRKRAGITPEQYRTLRRAGPMC